MSLGQKPRACLHLYHILASEKKLGFQLLPLLRRMYMEIGDGGFGPSRDGLYSLD